MESDVLFTSNKTSTNRQTRCCLSQPSFVNANIGLSFEGSSHTNLSAVTKGTACRKKRKLLLQFLSVHTKYS